MEIQLKYIRLSCITIYYAGINSIISAQVAPGADKEIAGPEVDPSKFHNFQPKIK